MGLSSKVTTPLSSGVKLTLECIEINALVAIIAALHEGISCGVYPKCGVEIEENQIIAEAVFARFNGRSTFCRLY